ncbi:MAG: hypothetical protein IAC77_00350 [Proteobacteria bacterium]|uniref:Transporter n=1 Tax=Candidatus Enterousia excrementavium TaxID=2840789 RepID=A0A940DCA9_9PROT|nr:hypothetical protein [Candidatus Enterousia excrementavium]
MKKTIFTILTVILTASGAFAADSTDAARGVNPADNLTKIELLPQLRAFGDSSITSLTLKYDHAIKRVFGINAELPLVRYSGRGTSDNGIGDLTLRGRAQHTWGRHTLIGAAEFLLPTATEDTLGAQQYTFDPILGYVYSFGHNIFGALVAKQFISLHNTDPAISPDINQGQYRMLLGYASNKGWWVLADPQVWVNFETGRQEFLAELELGTMLNKTTGVWIRAGHRLGGNWRRNDWTVLMGIRFMRF